MRRLPPTESIWPFVFGFKLPVTCIINMALVFIKYSNRNLLLIVTRFLNFQLELPTRASRYGRRNVLQDSAHHLNSIHGNVPTCRQLSRVLTRERSHSERMDSWFLDYFILNFHKIYIIILSEWHPGAFPVSNVPIIKRKIILWKHSIYNCPGAKTGTNQIKMDELL